MSKNYGSREIRFLSFILFSPNFVRVSAMCIRAFMPWHSEYIKLKYCIMYSLGTCTYNMVLGRHEEQKANSA